MFDLISMNIVGVEQISDRDAENCSGGAFTVNDGVETRIVEGDSTQFSIDELTSVLDIRNTDSNANDPRAGGHNFEVVFLNAGGDEVGFGNVAYDRGVFQEQINDGRDRGATAVRIRQNQLGSDCECERIF